MLHARATDPDDPLTPSGHLQYSFLGSGAVSKDGLFSIGEISGILSCPVLSCNVLLSKGRKAYVAFNLHTTYAFLPLDGSVLFKHLSNILL